MLFENNILYYLNDNKETYTIKISINNINGDF